MITYGLLLGLACGDYCYALVRTDHGPEQFMCADACRAQVARLKGQRMRIRVELQPMRLHGPDDVQPGVAVIERAR